MPGAARTEVYHRVGSVGMGLDAERRNALVDVLAARESRAGAAANAARSGGPLPSLR